MKTTLTVKTLAGTVTTYSAKIEDWEQYLQSCKAAGIKILSITRY